MKTTTRMSEALFIDDGKDNPSYHTSNASSSTDCEKRSSDNSTGLLVIPIFHYIVDSISGKETAGDYTLVITSDKTTLIGISEVFQKEMNLVSADKEILVFHYLYYTHI